MVEAASLVGHRFLVLIDPPTGLGAVFVSFCLITFREHSVPLTYQCE